MTEGVVPSINVHGSSPRLLSVLLSAVSSVTAEIVGPLRSAKDVPLCLVLCPDAHHDEAWRIRVSGEFIGVGVPRRPSKGRRGHSLYWKNISRDLPVRLSASRVVKTGSSRCSVMPHLNLFSRPAQVGVVVSSDHP